MSSGSAAASEETGVLTLRVPRFDFRGLLLLNFSGDMAEMRSLSFFFCSEALE
jgi:hypothetical protein